MFVTSHEVARHMALNLVKYTPSIHFLCSPIGRGRAFYPLDLAVAPLSRITSFARQSTFRKVRDLATILVYECCVRDKCDGLQL